MQSEWRQLRVPSEQDGNPLAAFGNTLDHSRVPWIDSQRVEALQASTCWAVVLLGPTRTGVTGLRIRGANPLLGQSLGASAQPGEAQGIEGHGHLWLIPLEPLAARRGLEIESGPDVPEVFALVGVITDDERRTVKVINEQISTGSRVLLAAVLHLLDLRVKQAKQSITVGQDDFVAGCRLNFLSFDFLSAPSLQLARSHYTGSDDLLNQLHQWLGAAAPENPLEPEV